MIRKKSSFLTFCFAFLPGAGQMYMGFMKRGVSLMSSFFLFIFLSSWLQLGPLILAIPVIWFYSFFDTFNLRSSPDDEFYALEDNYLLVPDFVKSKVWQGRYRMIIALALIVAGCAILWNNLYDIFGWIMPEYMRKLVYRFGYYFPQFLIGVGIIALGIYLIRGKKKDLDTGNNPKQIVDKGGLGL